MIDEQEFKNQVIKLMQNIEQLIDRWKKKKRNAEAPLNENTDIYFSLCEIFLQIKDKILESDKIKELENRIKHLERLNQSLGNWSDEE